MKSIRLKKLVKISAWALIISVALLIAASIGMRLLLDSDLDGFLFDAIFNTCYVIVYVGVPVALLSLIILLIQLFLSIFKSSGNETG